MSCFVFPPLHETVLCFIVHRLLLYHTDTAVCIACTYYILYKYICSSYCIIINAEHGVPSGDHNLDIQLQSILINHPQFDFERNGKLIFGSLIHSTFVIILLYCFVD